MRIRFLLHDIYGAGGGVLTVTLALAGELAKRHDVELVSLYRGGPEGPVHRMPPGVRTTGLIRREAGRLDVRRRRDARLPSEVVPAAEPRGAEYNRHTDRVLSRYLGSLDGGVLVTMQPGLNLASARLGTDRYLRVAQDHLPISVRPRGIRRAYRRLPGGLDMFLTLTDQDSADLRDLVGERVRVGTMTNAAPPYDGPTSDCTSTIVVAAGRLRRIKGFDVLVAAWSDVAVAHPDWQLQIWGEGELRDDLEREISERRLEGSVQLMGFTPRLQHEMAAASVFVLSSRAEGYGRVIIEAMACGLPVVSTDCPWGPRNLITHGKHGLLVPNEDASALADAIKDVIDRGAEGRRAMGAQGLARAEEHSQQAVARRWEELLAKLHTEKGLDPRGGG